MICGFAENAIQGSEVNPILNILIHKGSIYMTRLERNTMWNRFKMSVKKIWVLFYLRVISPCLTAIGNGVEKFDKWVDEKIEHRKAKRQYLKAMYDVDPVARLYRDVKQIKVLLVILMICVLALELTVIF